MDKQTLESLRDFSIQYPLFTLADSIQEALWPALGVAVVSAISQATGTIFGWSEKTKDRIKVVLITSLWIASMALIATLRSPQTQPDGASAVSWWKDDALKWQLALQIKRDTDFTPPDITKNLYNQCQAVIVFDSAPNRRQIAEELASIIGASDGNTWLYPKDYLSPGVRMVAPAGRQMRCASSFADKAKEIRGSRDSRFSDI